MKHLAVFKPHALEAIFSGKKQAESRFSRIRVPPYGFVRTGDIVLVKQSGGKIVGQFTIGKVVSFDHPGPSEFVLIKREWQKALDLADKFFSDNSDCRYVTIMAIEAAIKFLFPPVIKKHDQRAWVVLG